jgi:hypothetical protein
MGPARGRPISFAQTLTQVAFIAVIGSPMLISFDLSAVAGPDDPDVALFLNPEMLAVHWDAGIARPNYYAKLRGGFFGADKLPPRTRLPCNASDPTVRWTFLPTVNATTGYLESVNAPGLCLSAGPSWPFTTNNAQGIWLSACGGADCGDSLCSNFQFSFVAAAAAAATAEGGEGSETQIAGGNVSTVANLDWFNPAARNPAAGPFVTLSPVPDALFLEERLSGPTGSLFNDSTAQLWTLDPVTGLLANPSTGTCVGAQPRDTTNVWVRRLEGGAAALLLVNIGPEAATVSCDGACLAEAGFGAGVGLLAVRDIWARTDNGTVAAGDGYSAVVGGDGASVFVRLTVVGGEGR